MAYEYIERFKKKGFGMFNHFGLYSILGKGEWVYTLGNIDHEKYNDLIKKFKVRKDWAKQLVKTAKAAGCKYITLTTRHHDGFSLYDTKGLNEFDAPHSATGRDLVKEFVEECNKEGIVPFFYHTLLDWYNPDYKDNFPKYIDYLVKSIEILCTSYGKIGGFWFDGMWDKPNEDWQEDRIYGTIRKYQPEAMIINNTGLSECGKTGHREIDSVTFERGKAFFVNSPDKPIAGEVCEVIRDHWGYAKNDICVKSMKEFLNMVIDCRKYNCNLLLNTGLCGSGLIPEMDKQIFLAIGKWIKVNKNFIYDAVSADIEAENADILTDGKHYYAVIRDVPMAADPNVAREVSGKTVTIKTDKKMTSAKWLDSGRSVKGIKKNSFLVEPFAYGCSYVDRVAVFDLK